MIRFTFRNSLLLINRKDIKAILPIGSTEIEYQKSLTSEEIRVLAENYYLIRTSWNSYIIVDQSCIEAQDFVGTFVGEET